MGKPQKTLPERNRGIVAIINAMVFGDSDLPGSSSRDRRTHRVSVFSRMRFALVPSALE